jgi:hypothetical protein
MNLSTDLHLLPRSTIVEIYHQSPICIHGLVLNWLSTRTTLPFLSSESRCTLCEDLQKSLSPKQHTLHGLCIARGVLSCSSMVCVELVIVYINATIGQWALCFDFCSRLDTIVLFSIISKFWRNKARLMRSPRHVCVLPYSFWAWNPVFMKSRMYIVTPESISAVHKYLPLIFVSLLGNVSLKTLPRQLTYTQ